MPCNLKSIPTEIPIRLDYLFLPEDERPVHYFPRITYMQAREMLKTLTKDGEMTGDERTFKWWSSLVLDKTKDSYEGLGKDWKQELWDDPEGQWHIIHAMRGLAQSMVPQSFLPG